MFQMQMLVQLCFKFVVCFYTHPSFNIQFVLHKLCIQNGFYGAVFTLWIYLCISYPSSKPAWATISAWDCPVQRWSVYWCHSPSSGRRRQLNNEAITYITYHPTLHLLFLNRSEDPDSWLPTLFATLSLSFKIRKRGLLGSKGTWSRAHRLSFRKKRKKVFTG